MPSGGVPAKELSERYSLVTVASGAKSLRSLDHGETFHPVVGPMAEARGLHIAQSQLVARARQNGTPLVVWDVGLGAAANAIAVIEAFSDITGVRVELHSFDCSLEPLSFALLHAADLGYLAPHSETIRALLKSGRSDASGVDWRLHVADFREIVAAPPASAPDAILYDPYSPAANPGMWTLGHFRRLRKALDPARPCTLTSYSRSTSVRVTLALAGFHVGRGGATGAKAETTVAATHRDLLEAPLGADWLDRVGRSTRGAPLREGCVPAPITDTDLATLRAMLMPP